MTHVSGWRIVVPVKGGSEAKSRLKIDPPLRRALALAMALDTLSACAATPGVGLVVCVTGDEDVAVSARAVGAVTVAPHRAGLTEAIDAGLASLDRGPAAVLLGDVPALEPLDLQTALTRALAGPGPLLVADAEGSGSVLLADRDGRVPHRFGPDSARRHLVAGARALLDDVPSLRRDVDTLNDLADALDLGVGPHTRDVVADSAGHLRNRIS